MSTENNGSTGFEQAKFRMESVPLSQIRINKYSLRDVDRNSEDYQRLRDAIAATSGPMVSIVVREIDDPENPGQKAFGLIDGLQRFSCCQDLNFSEIPARVIDMDEADVAAAQIIANKSRIETKPVEYTKQLHRMLNANPTLTLEELSGQLHQSVAWLKSRLSLANLHEKLGKLVDDGVIGLAHAFALAKIKPADEQLQFAEQAQTMSIAEFNGQVSNHIKALRDAARTGRESSGNEFVPTMHLRKLKDIKDRIDDTNLATTVCQSMNAETPLDGFKAGLAWALHFDPESVEIAKQQYEDRKKQEAERRAKASAEKKEKAAAEARAVADKILAPA